MPTTPNHHQPIESEIPKRGVKAGDLARVLARHPDADVHLALPQQFAVTGAVFFANDDGTLVDTPAGDFLLTLDLKLSSLRSPAGKAEGPAPKECP